MSQPATDREVPIASPVTGKVIDLADVPDPVFSSKAVGDGLGVEPDDGAIVSPVDAEVTMVAGTGHAIGFKADSGLEVLVHLGVDTVELEGKPFNLTVSVGDTVKAGDKLGTMDLEAIRAAEKATTAIVVLTNTITHLESLSVDTGQAEAGATDLAGVGIVDAVELLKEVRQVFGGDADAAILDADGDCFVITSDIYNHFPVGRVFDGVFDQVRNNFAEVIGVDVGVVGWLDGGSGVRAEGADEAFFGGTWCQALKNLADEGGDIDNLWLVLEASVFGAADVK